MVDGWGGGGEGRDREKGEWAGSKKEDGLSPSGGGRIVRRGGGAEGRAIVGGPAAELRERGDGLCRFLSVGEDEEKIPARGEGDSNSWEIPESGSQTKRKDVLELRADSKRGGAVCEKEMEKWEGK